MRTSVSRHDDGERLTSHAAPGGAGRRRPGAGAVAQLEPELAIGAQKVFPQCAADAFVMVEGILLQPEGYRERIRPGRTGHVGAEQAVPEDEVESEVPVVVIRGPRVV